MELRPVREIAECNKVEAGEWGRGQRINELLIVSPSISDMIRYSNSDSRPVIRRCRNLMVPRWESVSCEISPSRTLKECFGAGVRSSGLVTMGGVGERQSPRRSRFT